MQWNLLAFFLKEICLFRLSLLIYRHILREGSIGNYELWVMMFRSFEREQWRRRRRRRGGKRCLGQGQDLMSVWGELGIVIGTSPWDLPLFNRFSSTTSNQSCVFCFFFCFTGFWIWMFECPPLVWAGLSMNITVLQLRRTGNGRKSYLLWSWGRKKLCTPKLIPRFCFLHSYLSFLV